MPLSVTPTLSSASGFLTDVRDQVASLVRFVIMNPGGTSNLWEDRLISFRYLSSKFEDNRTQLCSELSSKITSLLEYKFPDYAFDVNFTSEDYSKENDVRYTVKFSIIIDSINGVGGKRAALVDGDIKVDKATNNIELNFTKSADNSVLS